MYRGYYMPALGYEFCLPVFNSISSYRVEHEKVNFVSTSGNVIFCLLYKHSIDDVFDHFRRFPTTFRRFPKILQKFSEGQKNVSEHFLKIFEDWQRLSKVTEDFRGRTDDVSITLAFSLRESQNWTSDTACSCSCRIN